MIKINKAKDLIIKTKDDEIEKMKHEIEILKEQYTSSNRKRIQEESLRRKMHNEILVNKLLLFYFILF